MDCFLFRLSTIRRYIEVAGFEIQEIIEREPYAPEVEYQSREGVHSCPEATVIGKRYMTNGLSAMWS